MRADILASMARIDHHAAQFQPQHAGQRTVAIGVALRRLGGKTGSGIFRLDIQRRSHRCRRWNGANPGAGGSSFFAIENDVAGGFVGFAITGIGGGGRSSGGRISAGFSGARDFGVRRRLEPARLRLLADLETAVDRDHGRRTFFEHDRMLHRRRRDRQRLRYFGDLAA